MKVQSMKTVIYPCGLLVLGMASATAHADIELKQQVMDTYANIAQAGYADSLTTAVELREALGQLMDTPSDETLQTARNAWLAARVPYQQTEVYRFGNPMVDDWEGKVNAWPLDEGLIDYVDASYGEESDANELYTANIVANPAMSVNGQQIDASTITPALLGGELHEAGGIETNVATGYHAIEFLLWGQDLNGGQAGAGNRPYTDYDLDNCSSGNCDRRAQYLLAASDLLIDDLTFMAEAWSSDGEARAELEAMGPDGAVGAMLTGMGSLSYGELAGERMQLGLMLHDPEEEHDCFADNTSYSHFYDGVGIQNVFEGQYERINGDLVSGPSLADLVAGQDKALAAELSADIAASVESLKALAVSQDNGQAYDQLIAEGNIEGNALVQSAIDALIGQTRNIERAVVALGVDGITFEGSDSLDDPSTVFQ